MVIVGGGCAGLSAAWHLAQIPGHDIHLYEKSHVLGGKGASTRAADGRILEHGLHVWLGFYENAFAMMRACYDQVRAHGWGPAAPLPEHRLTHGSLDAAFVPEPHLGVIRRDPGGDGATAWTAFFPPEAGLPGTPIDPGSNPFSLPSYLLRALSLLRVLMLSVIEPARAPPPGAARPDHRSQADEALNLDFTADDGGGAAALIERMTAYLKAGSLTGAAALLQSVTLLEGWLRRLDFAPQVSGSMIALAEAMAAQARKLLRDIVAIDPALRARTAIIDIVITIAAGLFRDRVLFSEEGLDAINGYDFREWLHRHDATPDALESPFIVALYDFMFAYRDGDKARPALAAGVALRGALRMFFTYRGAMFWRLRSGMGDAVFAPLYKVLHAHNRTAPTGMPIPDDASTVTFHLQHELRQLRLSGGGADRVVTELHFQPTGDQDPGRLALDAHGSWPEHPAPPAASPAPLALKVTEDFDCVILATDLHGAAQALAEPLHAGHAAGLPPHWHDMVDHVATVATRAAQVWLAKDLQQLGWDRPSGLFTGMSAPFDTWADMTHTLAAEAGRAAAPAGPAAQSVAYFCGVLAEPEARAIDQAADALQRLHQSLARVTLADDAPSRARVQQAIAAIDLRLGDNRALRAATARILDRVFARFALQGAALSPAALAQQLAADARALALEASIGAELTDLLQDWLRLLWPRAFLDGRTAADAECARHLQANTSGAARYTQSLPGSSHYRISPLDRSVENLIVAGDWTACGLDSGCVEAAVISGMLAAHAVCGTPDLPDIVGYDHP